MITRSAELEYSWAWNLNFKLRIVFWNIFFFEIWRSEKRIALSEKKPPLILSFSFFAGRVGTCVHGHLHGRNGGQNLGWWFYFTQRKLPQKSLEYHGFYRCRIWVRIISKWAKNHLSTFPKIFRLDIFLTFPACF